MVGKSPFINICFLCVNNGHNYICNVKHVFKSTLPIEVSANNIPISIELRIMSLCTKEY